jgi:hypothetical protein
MWPDPVAWWGGTAEAQARWLRERLQDRTGELGRIEPADYRADLVRRLTQALDAWEALRRFVDRVEALAVAAEAVEGAWPTDPKTVAFVDAAEYPAAWPDFADVVYAVFVWWASLVAGMRLTGGDEEEASG